MPNLSSATARDPVVSPNKAADPRFRRLAAFNRARPEALEPRTFCYRPSRFLACDQSSNLALSCPNTAMS